MNRNDFDIAFDVKNKELWRKINKNKRTKPLNENVEI